MSHLTSRSGALPRCVSTMASRTHSPLVYRFVSSSPSRSSEFLIRPLVSALVQTRHVSSKASRGMKKSKADEISNDIKMSVMRDRSVRAMFTGEEMPLTPSIFVAERWENYPDTFRKILTYTRYRIQSWLTDQAMLWQTRVGSRKGFSFQYKTKRRAIPPAAKVMWQEVLEAFAAGDSATINRLCRIPYARQLNSIIAKRPKQHEVRFELKEWLSPRLYPSLMAHNVTPIEAGSTQYVEQAVVALKSKQQTATVDKLQEQAVPGTVRVQETVEYIVLIRWFNSEDWTLGPWKVWGTTVPTGLEEWMQRMAAVEEENAYRAGLAMGKKMKANVVKTQEEGKANR